MFEPAAADTLATRPASGERTRAGAPFAAAATMLDQLASARGQIDIWVTRVADVPQWVLAAQYDGVLSDDERLQHDKFVFEKDRRRYLVTRALVRYALSRHMPIAPLQWHFDRTDFGKPVIGNRHAAVAGLEFNISHSTNVVVLAVTRGRRLGVDVEDLRADVPLEIATGCFAGQEITQLHALPAALQPARFLDFWTLKESYIKARGKGLSLPLHAFGFELGGERDLAIQIDPALDDAPSNWRFWQWRPSPDSVGALCVENQAGAPSAITVRRTIAFVQEEIIPFDILRMSPR